MKPKTVMFLMAAAVALAVATGGQVQGVWAQAYPTKPIKIIVPFPPGNTMDIMSRLIGPKLSERLGQPVIVENRPGASGMLGLDLVVKSPPDGYTIGAGQGGNLVVLPHTSKNVPYDALKDFAPIAISTTNYLVIFANTAAPFKTLPEMIAYAKANPGKLTVASNGEGGFPHLAFEHLRLMAGFTYNYIPYKGSAQIADRRNGRPGPGGHRRRHRAYAPHPIGQAHPAGRHQQEPRGVLARQTRRCRNRSGLRVGRLVRFHRAGRHAREIVNKLNEEINRAMKSPDVADKMVAGGMVVVAESPKYFEEVIKSDYAKYGKLVRDIGFKPQ